MLHVIDSDGRIVSVNDHWLNTLGYCRDDVLGRRSVDFFTAESQRYALDKVLPQLRMGGSCYDIPLDMVRQDGTKINVLLSATSELDADGKFVRAAAAIVDITKQKCAEEALRQSERRYRAVAKASSDWIWETDADLRLVYPRGADGFQSPIMTQASETWSHTFTVAGTYEYHCVPHLPMGMHGLIVVDRLSANDEFHEPSVTEVKAYRALLLHWFEEEDIEDLDLLEERPGGSES